MLLGEPPPAGNGCCSVEAIELTQIKAATPLVRIVVNERKQDGCA